MCHRFPSSGRRPKLLFSQERKLVWLFGNNSQTNKAQACSPLETKPRWAERVLNEKEESAPKSTLSSSTGFAASWKNVLCLDETRCLEQ